MPLRLSPYYTKDRRETIVRGRISPKVHPCKARWHDVNLGLLTTYGIMHSIMRVILFPGSGAHSRGWEGAPRGWRAGAHADRWTGPVLASLVSRSQARAMAKSSNGTTR